MASKQIAVVMQKNFGRIGTVLIYAVLEWALILLLIIGALLSYFTRKFAEYFGLHPPCLWCNRLDHVLDNQEPGFYRKLVCDQHAREISSLGYCHAHKHLSDVQGMCEDCLLSFAEETKPSLCTYKGELDVDLEGIVHGGTQLGLEKDYHPDKKNEGVCLANHEGENDHWVHRVEENKNEINVNSQMEGKELGELSTEWISDGVCSCCKTPLKRSRLLLDRLVRIPYVQGQNGVGSPLPKAVVGFAEGVDREEVLMRSVEYPEAILQECSSLKPEDEGIEAEGIDLRWTPLGHIAYTELKDTSDDSASERASSEVGVEVAKAYSGQGLQGLDSQVEVISDSLLQGLVHDMVSDVENFCLGVAPDVPILENKMEAHKNEFFEEFCERSVGKVDSQTINKSESHKKYCVEEFFESPVAEVDLQTILNIDSMNAKSETALVDTYVSPENISTSMFGFTVLGTDGQVCDSVSHQIVENLCEPTELPHKTVEIIPSSEEVLIILDEPINKEISMEGSSSEGIVSLGYGLGELEWNGISENGHLSSVSAIELKEEPTEIVHAEPTSYPKDVLEANKVCFGTEVLKPVLSLEVKGTSDQIESVGGPASQVAQEDFGRESLNGSENIEANESKVELNSMGMNPFREEEANKPQEEVKLSPGRFYAKDLNRIDSLTSHGMVVGMSTVDEYRPPETPRFIEGLHMLHKRASIDRNDSGFDSMDGSILSELDGESTVDRLKRHLEQDRKSLHTLYSELEAERNASAIAANQAMAMITRLQEEKAAMQMEALQYQRMMDEQAEYDQEALQLLNEVLVKREKEIKDLEKEVELYRKKFHLEAAKKRKDKRKGALSKKSGNHLETERNEEDSEQHLIDQFSKLKTSSVSSSSEDTDESSSSVHEVEEDIDFHQNNQSLELTISASGVHEDQQLEDSLDESMVDLEEERLSILERLKSLQEKLHTLADDGDSEIGMQVKEVSDIGLVHREENAETQDHYDVISDENRSCYLATGENSSIEEKINGNEKCLPINDSRGMCDELKEMQWDKESQKRITVGKVDPSIDIKACTPRKSGVVKGKRLLPLFEAASFEDEIEESYNTEASYFAGLSNDWRSFSMIARDNNRFAIEEEVHHLNDRLQALEADREFMRHSIKSLRKGDEGMKLLQEIAQHLRELRRVEMRASNTNDSCVQQNAVFVSLTEGNGMITMQPHY
ncbi:uncharacterized protein LOC131067970 [Cryptomeria japonica]|uniref:uncharacterized protein LOC131067970 n=1 Tax=Cryptomeria japonica TaxID=3369 RepID=UPI0027DA6058|nr:uncharacterized protein LOC131067970 [Cryptomeria japonica]XP_057859135.2 uncharacterized protein LOC131067970 [Cryptomeria japonica]